MTPTEAKAYIKQLATAKTEAEADLKELNDLIAIEIEAAFQTVSLAGTLEGGP